MEWMWKDWEKCTGFLDAAQGRLWDSKRFPFAVHQRKGNMPPFCWVGDDDRGVCFSCASDQGMHNDDALPAATLDREGRTVVFRAWFVNKPLKLDRAAEFLVRLAGQPLQAARSGPPPVALRRLAKRLLLRAAAADISIRAGASATTGPPTGVFSIWRRTPRRSAACGRADTTISPPRPRPARSAAARPNTSSSGASGAAPWAGTRRRWGRCRSGWTSTCEDSGVPYDRLRVAGKRIQ